MDLVYDFLAATGRMPTYEEEQNLYANKEVRQMGKKHGSTADIPAWAYAVIHRMVGEGKTQNQIWYEIDGDIRRGKYSWVKYYFLDHGLPYKDYQKETRDRKRARKNQNQLPLFVTSAVEVPAPVAEDFIAVVLPGLVVNAWHEVKQRLTRENRVVLATALRRAGYNVVVA